ncbi:anaerobic c4-dicarboxylate membrane transporter family protein [Schinkia azotoformans MEV2011]|uniref:Anaerobic C4-dicarboxylate transporter n=2 Tax=Schinkia azotoformans TaxID=1454 RepID=K6D5D9_SCHAZ|nr:anaerobic C4-dicarboxylate transporter [Schinkia azotoformans]EKN63268.1 anaerobic C4-dicarboxylate transporter [Schinkia azotoformans LMG 9581]KEF36324.1 anaerobic c4-dicarboxylate membrane transporter family protein [Schinkia azotoformans MEV2011]MEC1637182.1 anaerobic C4-dicarboxylate transporter [Schinkia azotoformans]MEC1696716.1 anaerobic C4-dicarboxylate transporter [Schinkia azotoformans]MEC1716964.1 anaerobic C4-dicarboxylate transporter [Schinkia azotoformans]
MFWVQFFILLACIFVGARLGGLGLGVMGGVGLAILVFVFGLEPTSAPIDVMLMILAVITAAGALQASGGMDYLVYIAEKALRKNPKRITFMAPIITYLFTLCAGTGHVAYSVLPVIAEVSRESGVRPERPMSIAVIASQQAITASPISAATVALLALLADFKVTLLDILMICLPSTFIACMIGAFVVSKMGKELPDDPIYLKRLEEGLAPIKQDKKDFIPQKGAKLSVLLFLLAAVFVVLLGSFEKLRPAWEVDGVLTRMGMPASIEIVMLTIAALIIIFCKPNVDEIVSGSVFKAGAAAVVAIFGIAWMGDTFFKGNAELINGSIAGLVTSAPWLFAVALFALSILLYSQAATVRTLMPLGVTLGINPALLIAMFPAVNGYFFIPNYPTVVAAINFDRTGTTRIGKYILNHSFMVPGLVATIGAIVIGMIISTFVF